MGSALLDNSAEAAGESAPPQAWSETASTATAATDLRRQAAERLAAHRSRRAGAGEAVAPAYSPAPRNARSTRIAATVAERYARTQSYRDFLAAEAERAVEQARAAAEVAAFNARALAVAQQELLSALDKTEDSAPDSGIDSAPERGSMRMAKSEPVESIAVEELRSATEALLWPEPEEMESAVGPGPDMPRRFRPPAPAARRPRSQREQRAQGKEARDAVEAAGVPSLPADALLSPHPAGEGFTIRFYRDESGTARAAFDPLPAPPGAAAAARRSAVGPLSEEEARLLDEEIAFRHEPVFEEPAGPPTPLPANLIEFPRQLVAARKARPRLAEGPLREDPDSAADTGQLRIFEVDPAQIATVPETDAALAEPISAQWTTILLDPQPQTAAAQPEATNDGARVAAASHQTAPRAHGLEESASIGRRVLATAVNAAILTVGFALFAAAFLWIAGHMPAHGAASRSLSGEASTFLNRAAMQSVLPFLVCAFALLAAIYQALFFSLSTATPGMRCARVALCTFGGENPRRRAVRRRLLALLLSTVPIGLGFLWALLDEERLCWHDRICGIYQRSY